MGTLLIIILVIGGIFGLIALFASHKSDPKERAADAAGAALGGAMMTAGCIFQLILAGLGALIGIWLLAKIFGH